MKNKFTITADIVTNSAVDPIGLEVWINDALIKNIDPVESTSISFDVDDVDNSNQELKFILKNKAPEHTIVDNDGNIIQDSVVEIKTLKFDEIELGHMFFEKTTYAHNFNGTGPNTVEKFYGVMGCNGTVSLNFSTPIYLWLLENM